MDAISKTDVKMYFELFYDRLLLFAFKITDCEETSRDLVQDAFIVLIESGFPADKELNVVKSYLYKTVKNSALNYLRRQKISERVFKMNVLEETEDPIVVKLIEAEIAGEILKAMESLPKACKQIFKLGYFEGMKNKEIAAELNISINTIKTQKRRGIIMLRSTLPPQTYLVLLWILLN